MSELYDSIRLTHLAAAFTSALGVNAPEGAESPCDIVLDRLFAEFGEGGADRVFIYKSGRCRSVAVSKIHRAF